MPPRRRRWVRRSIVSGVVLAMVAYGTTQWSADARGRVTNLYWQDKCMTYTATSDLVIYEPHKGLAEKLRHDNRYFVDHDCAGLIHTPLDKLNDYQESFLPFASRGIVFLH